MGFRTMMARSSTYAALTTAGVGVALLASGCGNSSGSLGSMVEGVTVKSYQLNGDLWAELTATLSTGSFVLAGIDVPVVDPHNPNIQYGRITLQSAFCQPGHVCTGGGDLSLQINVTQAIHLSFVDPTLPNGTMIPIGGLNTTPVIALPIGSTGARVYVALSDGVALLGAALPFKQLDSVGQYVPGTNLFFPFSFSNVNGLVGMFFGAQTKQTGIALFADLSGVIDTNGNPINPEAPISSPSPAPVTGQSLRVANVNSLQAVAVAQQPMQSKLVIREVKPSSSKTNKIYSKMYNLNQKGGVLSLQ